MSDTTKVLSLTADSCRDLMSSGSQPVLIDFWAPWCPPCRAMAPTVDTLAAAYSGRVAVAAIDIDEFPELAEELGVISIPTLVLFRDGKEVDRLVGARAYPELVAALDALIDR